MMRRLVPYPLLALGLAATWLLLQESLAPLDVATALVLGLLLSRLAVQAPPRIRRPLVALRLLFLVLYDVTRSNFAVIAITLGRSRNGLRSEFVNVPLEISSPAALAALAAIITATPGTFWAAYDKQSNVVTIHVLDLLDHDAWVHTIKHRYERCLHEVFE